MFGKNTVKITEIRLLTLFMWALLFSSFAKAATINVTTAGQDNVMVETPSVSISTGLSTHIQCADTSNLSEPGQPLIPWKVVTVLLPPDANLVTVSCTVNDIILSPLTGTFHIEPSPLVMTWDEDGEALAVIPEGRSILNGYDMDVYGTDEVWPQEDARIFQTGQLRQWKLAEIAVPLVRYNPVTGTLQEVISTDIDITFACEITTANTTTKRNTSLSSKRGQSQSHRVKQLAANFEQANSDYDTLQTIKSIRDSSATVAASETSSYGYVIITTDEIATNSTKLDAFVTHKQKLGYDAWVATESDWGGGTGSTAYNNLHAWLQSNYLTYDLVYVLLIGTPDPDSGTVPMRSYDDGRGASPTDYFYSSFTGDAYWELAVGRIPYYGSITTLDNLLQKAMDYENSTDLLWRNKALLPIARLDANTPMYQCGEQIKDDILDPMEIESDRIYEQDFGVDPEYTYQESPTTDMDEVWASEPYGMVFWCTHGSQTLAQYFIDTSGASQLNDDYPSIVYQGSCQNGWPENSSNLAYTILKNGGITTVASTRNSFYSEWQTSFASDGCIGGLAYRYANQICNEQETVGIAWSNARQNSNTYAPCRMRMTLYGDPSISLTFSQKQVVHYAFDGNLNDSSGNGCHGIASGSPTYVTGIIDQAINLDGEDDFITLPAEIDSEDITIATWVCWDGGTTQQPIFDFSSDASNYMSLTPCSTDNTLQLALKKSTNRGQKIETDALTEGEWMHVGVTLEGDTACLYVNGLMENSNEKITTNPSDIQAQMNYIGISHLSTDPLFNGRLDDFRIYNHALSEVDFADKLASPTAPTDLTVEIPAQVRLDWADNSEADLAGYNVYRRSSSDNDYAVLAQGLTESDFSDTSVILNTTYYYVVTAEDYACNESDFSDEVAATVIPALLAHYTMNNTLNDDSDNDYHATAIGSPQYKTGKLDTAIDLDGSADYLTLPTGAADTQDITVALWAYWDGGDAWQRLFDFGNNTSEYLFLTPKSSSSTLRFAIKDGGSEQLVETSQLSSGQWTHVAVTLSENTAKLYVDGVLKDTNTSTTINPSDFSPALNYIGKSQWDDPLLNGRIDDLRIYNYALTADEIEDLGKTSRRGS